MITVWGNLWLQGSQDSVFRSVLFIKEDHYMLLTFYHSQLYLPYNIAYLGNSEQVCSNKLSTAWAKLDNRRKKDFTTNLLAALHYQILDPGNAWCVKLPHSWSTPWRKGWQLNCVILALVTGLQLSLFIIQEQCGITENAFGLRIKNQNYSFTPKAEALPSFISRGQYRITQSVSGTPWQRFSCALL